jgi:hypothetical protein
MRLALYTTRRLSIDAVIRAPLPAVRAALPTPEHLIRLNPLVVDVRRDPRDAELYHIADRLRFLGLPLRLRYRARIRRGPAGVDYEAWSGPALHIVAGVRFVERAGETLVREDIELAVLRPVAGYTARTAEAGHRALWRALNARLAVAA